MHANLCAVICFREPFACSTCWCIGIATVQCACSMLKIPREPTAKEIEIMPVQTKGLFPKHFRSFKALFSAIVVAHTSFHSAAVDVNAIDAVAVTFAKCPK